MSHNHIVDNIRFVVEAVRTRVTPELLTTINTYNKFPRTAEEIEAGTWSNEGEIPYFIPGHPVEINNRLMDKNDDKVYKYKKYPLIALRLDIQEPPKNGIANYNLNLAFMNFTDENYNAEQRIENVFKPILWPLYDLFFEELEKSGKFFWTTTGMAFLPEHNPVERPFWGKASENKNDESVFEDPLDAIEILNLRISSYLRDFTLCVNRLE